MGDLFEDRCQSCGGSGTILPAMPDRGPAPKCSFCGGSGRRTPAPVEPPSAQIVDLGAALSRAPQAVPVRLKDCSCPVPSPVLNTRQCSNCFGKIPDAFFELRPIATMGRQELETELRARRAVIDFAEYERRAAAVAFYPDIGSNPVYPVLGLAGEVGEVAEKVKKVLRDKGGVFDDATRAALKKELGDVLWYVTMAARELGSSLAEVALVNLGKLEARAAKGTLSGSGDDR